MAVVVTVPGVAPIMTIILTALIFVLIVIRGMTTLVFIPFVIRGVAVVVTVLAIVLFAVPGMTLGVLIPFVTRGVTILVFVSIVTLGLAVVVTVLAIIPIVGVGVVIVRIVVSVMVAFSVVEFLGGLRDIRVFMMPVAGFTRFVVVVGSVTVGFHYFGVPIGAMCMPAGIVDSAQHVGQPDYYDAQYQQGSGAGYGPPKSGPETFLSAGVL